MTDGMGAAFQPPSGFEPLSLFGQDTFEGFVGPMYSATGMTAGSARFGFLAAKHHANPFGIVHGGMLVTVVDTMMGSTVFHSLAGQTCATTSLTTDFLAAAKVGDWIEGEASLTRMTQSIAFVRGELRVGDRRILTATGTWAIIDRGVPGASLKPA
jgi:uncharacterized protein (TIGR00369 family)